jgi:hypothetical protein
MKKADIIRLYCRLAFTRDSSLPVTIKKWKGLHISVGTADSLKQFKTKLRNMDNHRLDS